MNRKVSLTLNNQDGMATKYDWIVVVIFFVIHLNALYWATQFVWSALESENGCYEGVVILKTVMWLMIYACTILIGLLITGFPTIADWATKKDNNTRWRIRLL